jgi:ankyrin repeat protein
MNTGSPDNLALSTVIDETGRSSLHLAVLQDNIELGKLLLLKGLPIDAKDEHGNTSLHYSCYHNSIAFTSLLISHGANIDRVSERGDTPLDYAIEGGHLEIIKLLIKFGSDVNLCDGNDWSPLHNSAEMSGKVAIDIIKLLLDSGANPNRKSKCGQYPYDAAQDTHVKALLFTAKTEALPLGNVLKDSENNSLKENMRVKETALHHSVTTNDKVTMLKLLSAGSRVDTQDNHGNTPLHNASYHNSVELLAILLDQEGSVRALGLRSSEGDTPLDYACTNGHIDIAKMVVNGGAVINSQDNRGWSALHNSCTKKHKNGDQLVQFLLDSGADPFLVNSEGQRAFDITLENSIKYILKIRMDVIEADSEFLDGGMEF